MSLSSTVSEKANLIWAIADKLCLRYLMKSLVMRGYIDIICNKATIPHFTKEKLAHTPCPIIPDAECQKIANFLDAQCTKIDADISKRQAVIEKLQAYKKSLIYEVVTGKREVPDDRQAATINLPCEDGDERI